MHHVTLHKSSEDVDVTYKADVKFNVMGPRAKSGCIATSTAHSAPQLRPRTRYVSTAWCINFDQFVARRGRRRGRRRKNLRRWNAISRVYRRARATESPTRVTLHPGWEIARPRLPLQDARKKERFTWDRVVDCLVWEEFRERLNNRITNTHLFTRYQPAGYIAIRVVYMKNYNHHVLTEMIDVCVIGSFILLGM